MVQVSAKRQAGRGLGRVQFSAKKRATGFPKLMH